MKLARLEVDAFKCVASARLELGPGLNVLYGPNDLGKSSLAWAIRAVLLLQHNQANGNIMRRLEGVDSPTGVAWQAAR